MKVNSAHARVSKSGFSVPLLWSTKIIDIIMSGEFVVFIVEKRPQQGKKNQGLKSNLVILK